MKFTRIFNKKYRGNKPLKEPRLTDDQILQIRKELNINPNKKIKYPNAYQRVI